MATVLGALTGTNPVIPATYITTVTWFGRGLAVLAAIRLALRLKRGAIPRTLWVWLAVILFYWVLMGAAARPPEGSRYVFVGAVGVLLVAAEAMAGRVSGRVTAAVAIIVALALPANIAQLRSGREDDALHHDAPFSKTEFAMIELARRKVDPEYIASADPNVTASAADCSSASLPAPTCGRSNATARPHSPLRNCGASPRSCARSPITPWWKRLD